MIYNEAMNGNDLEKLKKRLYKKDEEFKERKFKPFAAPRTSAAKTYWEESLSEADSEEGRLLLPEKPKMSFSKKIIIISASVLFLSGTIVSVYFLLGGPAIVSSKNIDIKFEGPSGVKGGEANIWRVLIANKNETNIELADLIIEYPENSMPVPSSAGGVKNLYERRPIGMIKAGETIEQTIKAYLFGEKDSEKKIKLTLEYRPEGSNAILAKTGERSVRLLQSPVELFVNLPREANAGEVFSFEVDIISNTAAIIKNMNLKIEYPSGFQYLESDIGPVSGDAIWRLGDLEPNKKRTVKIKGILEGQDQMELSFRVLAGPIDDKGEVAAYGYGVKSIVLKKPFLKLGVKINGRTEETIVSSGAVLKIDIDWQNTLPVKIYNAVVEVKIKGDAVNQRTISVAKGFYRSFDQSLVWNQTGIPELREIEPLGGGEAQFNFSLFDPLSNEIIKQGNPTAIIEIEIKAERTGEEGRVEIKNRLTKEIKIATSLRLNRKGLYYSGPFKNTGFLPPKAGKETTYTVVWSLSNAANVVSDAAISAFLPSYVRWLGIISPEEADVSYNQTTGEIVWRPGDIPAGAGVIGPSPELYFQIVFLPSASQIGTQPIIISETVLSGKDTFTGAFLRDVKSAITTYLDADLKFEYNDAIVAQ